MPLSHHGSKPRIVCLWEANLRDKDKTKAQLIAELAEMRQRLATLEASDPERVQTEPQRDATRAALRESEQRYRSLFDGVPVGLYRTMPTGQFVDANPALVEMLGYPDRDALLAINAADLYVDAEDRVRWQAQVEREGTVPGYETRLQRHDGTVIWARTTAHALLDGEGQLLCYEGSLEDITERKLAEAELRQLSEVVNQSPMYILITDPHGAIEYANPAFLDITGYTQQEVLGKNPRILQSGQTPLSLYQELWDTVLSGKTWKGELLNKKKDGTLYWESATISPSVNSDGVITHLVAVKEDITERKRMEEALRTTQMHFTGFMDASTDGVSYWRAPTGLRTDLPVEEQVQRLYHSVCVDANRAILAYYGLGSRDEIVGKEYVELVGERTLDQAFADFVNGGYQLRDYETSEVLLDGTTGCTLENWFGIVKDGMLVSLWTSSKVITKQKRAEIALQESEAKYRTVVENANEAIGIVQANKTVYYNPRWLEMTGYSAEEYESTGFGSLIHPDEAEAKLAEFARWVAGGEAQGTMELRALHKSGKTLWLSMKVSRADWQGQPAVLLLVEDTTERKLAEEQLRQKDYIIESASSAIATSDLDGKMTYANPVFLEMWGFDRPDEFLGKPFTEYWMAAERFDEFMDALWNEGRWTDETQARRKDGSIFDVQVSAAMVRDREGNPVGFMSSSVDLTDQKRMEIELQTTQMHYTEFIDSSSDGVSYWKVPDGLRTDLPVEKQVEMLYHSVCIEANDKLGDFRGLGRRNEIVGREYIDLVRERTFDQVFADFIDNDYQINRYEVYEQLSNGAIIYTLETWHGLVVDGVLTHVWAVTEDITERRQVEEALRESQARYQGLFENSLNGVALHEIICDEDGKPCDYRFLEVNPAFEEMTGFLASNVIGKTARQVVPTMGSFWIDLHGRVALTGEPAHLGYHTELADKHFEVSVFSPQKGRSAAVVQDITERVQAEEALRESEVRYRTLFQSAKDAILIMRGARFIECNPAAEVMFGSSRSDLMGSSPLEFSPPYQPSGRSSEEEALMRIDAALAGTPQSFEWIHRRLDGTLFDWEVSLNRMQLGGELLLLAIGRDITERKQAEEALRASEERLDLALQGTNTGLHEWYPKTGEGYLSPTWFTMLGYEPDAFPHTYDTWAQLLHPEDRPKAEKATQEFLRSGDSSLAMEFRMRGRDGQYRWIHGQDVAVGWDENGDVARIIGTQSDITERVQAEAQMRTEKEFTDTALDAQLDTFFLFEPDTAKAVRWNRAFSDISGYADEEIAAQPAPASYYSAEDLERAGTFNQKVLEEGTGTIELELVCKDGRKVPTEYRVSVINDDRGEPKYIISIGRDITERKQAELSLRESEEMIRALVETSKDWIWSIGLQGIITYCNPAVEAILGYRAEELVGKQSLDLIHDEDRVHIEASLQEWVREKRGWNNQLIRWRHKNGSYRYLESNAAPILDAENELIGFRGVDRDITARKLAEEELRETHQLLETIYDHTHMMVAYLDPQFNFVRVNRAYAQTDDREPSFFAGRNHFDLYPNAENEVIFRRVVETGEPHFEYAKPFEYDEHPERGVSHWDWSLVPIEGAEGTVAGLVLTLLNVTERVQAEEERARLLEQVQRHAEELEQRVSDRTRELAALYDIASVANQNLDLHTTLERTLQSSLEAIHCKLGGIHLLEDILLSPDASTSEPGLRLVVQQGIPAPILAQREHVPPGSGLIGLALQQGNPIVVPNLGEDPRTYIRGMPPELAGAYAVMPLRARGQVTGTLVVGRGEAEPQFTAEEMALLTSIADQVGIVVESTRLRAVAERSAVLEERGRLARDLHDSVTQSLYSLTLLIEGGRRMAQLGELENVQKNQERLSTIAQRALREMRLLVYELRPSALEAKGMIEALRQRLEIVERRAGIDARLEVEGDPKAIKSLPAPAEEDLYHLAQEALNNALKHADASAVTVTLRAEGEHLELEVSDDGRGFDVGEMADRGGLGLVTMRERAKKLGGSLTILSTPGKGTKVTIVLEVL
jgi:PAS domain S-box-containing protein